MHLSRRQAKAQGLRTLIHAHDSASIIASVKAGCTQIEHGVYADDAVRELNRKGFRARRLIDGFPEWKQAGLPVAAGDGG